MEIHQLRTQFEIRYTPILDFSSRIRPIVSPYLRLAQKYAVDNRDQIDEYIRLIFSEENFIISFHWDRIVINTEGEFSNIFSTNSTANEIFFSVFNQILEFDSFGKISYYVFETFFVRLVGLEKEQVIRNFKDAFLRDSMSEFSSDLPEDIEIRITKKDGNKVHRIHSGPYMNTDDIKAYNLLPFSNLDCEKQLKEKYGYIVQVNISEKSEKKITSKIVNSLIEEADKYQLILKNPSL